MQCHEQSLSEVQHYNGLAGALQASQSRDGDNPVHSETGTNAKGRTSGSLGARARKIASPAQSDAASALQLT